MVATDLSVSRSSRDAAVMRARAMNWLGVRPKNRFVKRANRCGFKPARRAREAGVIASERWVSKWFSAAATLAGISSVRIAARTSREMPMSPTIAPAALRRGNFVVRHHPGLFGAYQCSSR